LSSLEQGLNYSSATEEYHNSSIQLGQRHRESSRPKLPYSLTQNGFQGLCADQWAPMFIFFL